MMDSKSKSLSQLGKIQLDHLFAPQDSHPEDDREFVPFIEEFIGTFSKAGFNEEGIAELWEYATRIYDGHCREAAPEYSFVENRELFDSFLKHPRPKPVGLPRPDPI